MTEQDKIEVVFFDVLKDLSDYMDDLTLVGGWLPYAYSRFLWNNIILKPVTTVDIDFGVKGDKTKIYPKTIFETLSHLDYTEHHTVIGKTYPVVLNKKGKVPVEFVASPGINKKIIEKFIGRQISINQVEKFDFLLKYKISLNIKNSKTSYKIYCPKPSAFLYHKGLTFIDREDYLKKAKDLYYMYFMLRFAPDINTIFEELNSYKKDGYSEYISGNIDKYFERESSQGCLMVEKENGVDEYIEDLRKDIFERFRRLREYL